MKSLPAYDMKKYFIFTGAIIIIALVFYLGVKSEKIIEVLSSGGIVGILAFIFNRKRTGSRHHGGGNSRDPGISVDELEGIRKRYRDANDRIQSGLGGAKQEAGQLREVLQRNRERIRGYEDAGSGVRTAANDLDDLIRRIQEEGID